MMQHHLNVIYNGRTMNERASVCVRESTLRLSALMPSIKCIESTVANNVELYIRQKYVRLKQFTTLNVARHFLVLPSLFLV